MPGGVENPMKKSPMTFLPVPSDLIYGVNPQRESIIIARRKEEMARAAAKAKASVANTHVQDFRDRAANQQAATALPPSPFRAPVLPKREIQPASIQRLSIPAGNHLGVVRHPLPMSYDL